MSDVIDPPPGDLATWSVAEARDGIEGLVDAARHGSPQRITAGEGPGVVVMSAVTYLRLTGRLHEAELVDVLRESPFARMEFEPLSERAAAETVDA